MPKEGVSCLVKQLQRYKELDDWSMTQLAQLVKEERTCKKHEEISHASTVYEYLYFVKHGWLYIYTDWDDGPRQIIKVHLPGDVIGFRDVAFEHVSTTLRAAEDSIVCPFPKQGLTEIFNDNPRLAALLFSMGTRDQLAQMDIMKAIGQMPAYYRVLFFLLHILARFKVANPNLTDGIRVPLTQSVHFQKI